MKLVVRRQRDLALGLLLIATGCITAIIAAGYPHGSLGEMGPGYAPYYLGWLLVAFGIAIVVRSIAGRHADRWPQVRWSALMLVPLAVLVFGWAISSLGLAAATFLCAVLTSAAIPRTRWWEAALWALALGVLLSILFVALLRVPLPVWPW